MTNTPEKGIEAYQNGDFATALTEWLTLAQEGNAQACHNIAILYLNGQGVEQDTEQGKMWCLKAAERGHTIAKTHLGFLFAEEGNMSAAIQWWEQAAQEGNADAQNQLGLIYHRGEGVTQDDETAADWFEAAAMQNQAEGQFNLGVLYANGQRFAHAKHWWQKAADQGYQPALDALSQLANLETQTT